MSCVKNALALVALDPGPDVPPPVREARKSAGGGNKNPAPPPPPPALVLPVTLSE